MTRGPTELALESNKVAELVDTGANRAVRRWLLMDRRFRSRSKIEAAELALETACNLIAVHVTSEPGATDAIAEIRKLLDCLNPELDTA